MTYGVPNRGNHAWTLPEDESRPFLAKALDLGITTFDTANSYSDGPSEEILGRALKDYVARDEVVIATKVYFPMSKGPNGGGLSRKAIFASIDASLKRLGADFVDLYQIHRWDYGTPIEETMEALHDVVKAGKVRYLGASSMYAWQFAKALSTSRLNGWTEFVSMQNQLNLLYREEEREMLPLCADEGVGVLPWSPLARGRLTREAGASSGRQDTDAVGKSLFEATEAADAKVIDAVGEIAKARGVPRAQIALAWVLDKEEVTAPIIGASKPHHLEDAVAALSLDLTSEEIEALEAPYTPHAVAGFS